MRLLDLPFLLETRRNHALEHATLKVLGPRYPGRPLAGHSNPTGFFILGDVDTDDLRAAVVEALDRLRAGESDLAIHPGCGTNYATSGLLAGSVAWYGMMGNSSWRKRLWRLPFVFGLTVIVWGLSKPLGPALQAGVTTEARMGDLEVVSVSPVGRGKTTTHRIITRS